MTNHSSGITKEYIDAIKPAAFARVFGKAVNNDGNCGKSPLMS
jgi:hypothetical protein